MVNKRIGFVGTFGSCKDECAKGEPVLLQDGRFLQANRCPIGNICVVVSEEVIQDTTQLDISHAIPAAIYTAEELENLGSGIVARGIGRALAGIAQNPEAFVCEAEKPEAAEPGFYDRYFDTPFI
jgi:hypothetical protein